MDSWRQAFDMTDLVHAFFGAAWTYMVLHIQEHFFLPKDLTGEQLLRLQKAKWWLTLLGAIGYR